MIGDRNVSQNFYRELAGVIHCVENVPGDLGTWPTTLLVEHKVTGSAVFLTTATAQQSYVLSLSGVVTFLTSNRVIV